MTDYPSLITITCRHCGPVATIDAGVIRGMLDIVGAMEVDR